MCRQRLQTWVLRFVGGLDVLAFGAAAMPQACMDAVHGWLGLADMPRAGVFDSVMRQVSFTYGLQGVALWIIASDVVRYRPLVVFTGVGYLLAGPTFLAVDWTNHMPWIWVLGNGGSCLLIGVVLLGLTCWPSSLPSE